MQLIPAETLTRSLERLERVFAQTMQPVPEMSVPDWADKYRQLSRVSGAIGGQWRTSRVEVARGPMMAVKEPGVKTITVMSCTQLMKTSLLENVFGYHAHLDPCPILLTEPKEDAVKTFSIERLAPMVRATPVLRKIIGDERTRRTNDTIGRKEFPGGFLAMESAGSPTNLAMRAIRITLLDEIDKYETTKEGDPVNLAEERTSTFDKISSLHIRACSPTWEETSRIAKSYGDSDMRRPFVKCPKCRRDQTLDFFKHVHWSKNDDGEHFPLTAAIYCESCGHEWSEAERSRLMTTKHAIRWFQTRPFVCCGDRQEPIKDRRWKWDDKNQVGYACCKHCGERAVSNAHAGFNAGKLYSPFITVPELAQKWTDSKDDPETKQTFYNTQLGLPFAVQALKKIESHGLAARREQYPALPDHVSNHYGFAVPRGVVVITAGLDVQSGSEASKGRVEAEVVGWGVGEESWSLVHEVFTGDPARPELWQEVDEFLMRRFYHELGGEMAIRAACIDSGGHNTQEVYKFARARVGRNVWAIKGAADRGGQWSPLWPAPNKKITKTRRTGYKPVIIGVNAGKEAVRQRLLIEEAGPGYCHFPVDRPEVWFDQLTSEQLVIEKKGGFNLRKWVLQRGRANEALDERVYAYAALQGLYIERKMTLEKLAEAIELFGVQKSAGRVGAPAQSQEDAARPRVRRSRFVS